MSAKRTGIVRVKLDPRNPPRLTAKQRSRLHTITDDKIDLKDMPEMGSIAWTRPGSLVPVENKEQITLRIDADVVDYSAARADAIRRASTKSCGRSSTPSMWIEVPPHPPGRSVGGELGIPLS